MLLLLQLLYPVLSLSLAPLFSSGLACHANAYSFLDQEFLTADPPPPAAAGLCQQPFTPTPQHPVPGRKPLFINETINFHERHVNGSRGGQYRRSSCPAVNTLANRGFINRSGRDITADELIQAFIKVFNFGIDNIVTAVWPAFLVHGSPTHIDLDQFNDDRAQHVVNCPAAPTRNDRELGENVNINVTLFDSLLGFSKDGETLSFEDLAEHHHLRHNQSKAENPKFRFGNRDALCSLAQYSNLVGTIGRTGKHGLFTLYIEDAKTFFLEEDLPATYERRELPFYTPEGAAYLDRMSQHIGFTIERPFPPNDADGRDVEPEVANYEKGHCCRGPDRENIGLLKFGALNWDEQLTPVVDEDGSYGGEIFVPGEILRFVSKKIPQIARKCWGAAFEIAWRVWNKKTALIKFSTT